jgi:hypothetical protein
LKLFLELRISFYLNIDAGSSFIRRSILRHYFPEIQIQQIFKIDSKDELQIHDIKEIPISAKEFVELLIILFFNDGEEVRL